MQPQPSQKLSEAMDCRNHPHENALRSLKPEVDFRIHFASKDIAAKFEHHAAIGDPYAIERLYQQYMDFTSNCLRAPTYKLSHLLSMIYYMGMQTINREEAKKIEPHLNNAATAISSDEFINSGRRMPHPPRLEREFPVSMMPVEGLLDYLASYEDYTNSRRMPRAEDGLWRGIPILSSIEINRPDPEPDYVKAYLKAEIDNDLHCMGARADCGDKYAASLLAKFFARTTLKYHEGFFKFSYSTTPNSRHSSQKAEYWKGVYNLLSGQNEKSYDQYVEKRLGTAIGTYDVAEAIINNKYIRAIYNRRHHLGDGDTLKGALDLLKKSVELGNANAAWRIARLYHEQYIAQDKAVNAEHAYAWYAKANEMGNKEAALVLEYFNSRMPNVPKAAEQWGKLVNPKPIAPDSDHINERHGHSRGQG